MSHLLLFFSIAGFFSTGTAQLGRCTAGDGVEVRQVTEPVEHGEGPHWDPRGQALYFVDISNQTVSRYRPQDNTVHSVYIEGGPVSPVVAARKDGWFVVGRGRDLVLFPWASSSASRGPLTVLTTVDKDKPKNRFNDGKADASGRLWIGTMGPEDPTLKLYQGSLFSFEARDKMAPRRHVTQVSVSNGLGWNRNDTLMFYIDSPTRNVDVFDFDLQRGALRNRRVAFSLEKHGVRGVPDGLAVDSEDRLWVAVYGGSAVLHVDPASGALLRTVNLPASHVTSCAFGGPGLSVLYVTTSRRGLTPQLLLTEPQAGAVFALHGLGAKGQRKTNTAYT